MKRSLLLICLCLVVVSGLLTSSCGQAAPTDTITIASGTQSGFTYEATDPIVGESFWGWALYDPLVIINDTGDAIGVVAESWTLSADGLTWTFKIRKGIKFHNGDPLTSADVLFSVAHYSVNTSTNPWSAYLRNNFASSSCPDENTYVYVTKTPEPPLILPFGNTRILPKKYFESVGQDAFRKAPIGSGPYKFVKWVPSTSFEMTANTEYWGKKASYKTVIDLLVPEEATRVAMIKSGQADIAAGLTPDRVVELKNLGFKLQEYGLPSLCNISFPGTWETESPTKDIRVRQAISYALNRQEMCDTYWKGLAKPGSRWYINEQGYGWDPTWKPDPYDPAKSKALLAEAGYPSKFANPVITLYAQAGTYSDIMQMIQGYCKAVGIQTEVKIVDSKGYLGLFFYGNRDPKAANIGAVIPWYYPTYSIGIYHTANMFTSKGAHSTGNDPQADELYKKATTELDPVKAKKYYTEFENYAYGMWVNVGILQMPTYAVIGKNIGAFTNYKSTGIYYALSGIQHPKK